VRAGNVIGGGDWSEDRLVPDVVKSISNGVPITLRNPNAIRPWQHVLEPLFAYLLLGANMYENKTAFCEPWNIGPLNHDTKTVLEVCESVLFYFGKGKIEIENSLHKPHEAGKLKLDISKFGSVFNWKPQWNSDIAIHRTAAWYKAFLEGQSAAQLMDSDILAYLNNE
jgi:CDP-glucose 4,6-dehydratase